MPREPVIYRRPHGQRDPSIFYIAAEGEKTEVQYFSQLKSELNSSRVQLHIIEREQPSHSAPRHVLASLLQFKKTEKIKASDQLWLVIDKDRWQQQLDEVCANARKENIHIAFSSPCFELWLLLHLRKIRDINTEYDGENKKAKAKAKVIHLIRREIGQFNPTKLNARPFISRSKTAIANAREITPQNCDWFHETGSTVYKIIEQINQSFNFIH